MSWVELLTLVGGDPTALETYLQEYPDLGPELYGAGRVDAYLRALMTRNLGALAILVRYLPLEPYREQEFAKDLSRIGWFEALALLSPLAVAAGAVQANNAVILDSVLPRVSATDMLHVLQEAADTKRYLILQHLIDYVQRHLPEAKTRILSDVLGHLTTESNLSGYDLMDLASVITKLVRAGARLAPTDLMRVIGRIVGQRFGPPGLDNARILRALYEIGGGEYLSPYIAGLILPDQWTALRYPMTWDWLPRRLATMIERDRRLIQRMLMATVGSNLTQYVLKAI